MPELVYAHVQDDGSPHLLRMLEGIFSHDAATIWINK